MLKNRETLKLLVSVIEKIRIFHGESVVPKAVCVEDLYQLIGSVQEQRQVLKRARSDMNLYEIAKRVCEARVYDLDTIHNTILARAYHIGVMNYYGARRAQYAREKAMRRRSFDALEAGDGGRE